MLKKAVIGFLILAVGAICVLPTFYLKHIGHFLQENDTIDLSSADIAVVLRGGTNFDRILEAYEVWKGGYAPTILIPKSLNDKNIEVLENLGVTAPFDSQLVLKDILRQLGVPEENILLDFQSPGGGTVGEAKRVKKFIDRQPGYRKIIIITSWYHRKRANKIYDRIFKETHYHVSILPALTHSLYHADNWWHFRYQVITVFEEYLKLMLDPFHGHLSFANDPD